MASISRESNGRRTIQFVGPDGKRKSVRLGKVSQRTAEGVKVRMEALVVAQLTGQPVDDETARWLADRDNRMADKLARVDLIPQRKPKDATTATTLGPFLTEYIKSRVDVKRGSVLPYRQTQQSLVSYFGADKPLADISEGDADGFKLDLKAKGYAAATVSRRVKYARQFLQAAARKRIIPGNPFADLKAGSQENRGRFHFVTREEAQKVLDACNDAEWRLLFALSRFGGLRCPSEHLALRWGDVNWEHSRITVRSCKTEHHEGKGTRVVPLFSELRPYLEAAFDEAEPGTEYVITRYRDTNANLRTQLDRIIRRAGLTPWEKPFQNCRATRETELAEDYPLQVVCEWIGNSPAIAARHYLQVTDEHFRRAVEQAVGGEEKAVQNPVQQAHVCTRTVPQTEGANPGFSRECEGVRAHATPTVGPGGFEPPTKGL
jgi:site-specific recombinase XerD